MVPSSPLGPAFDSPARADRRRVLGQLGRLAAGGIGTLAGFGFTAGPAHAAPGDPPALPPDPRAARLHWSAQPATAREDLPAPNGWRLPGEHEPTRAIWLSYDDGHAEMTAGLIGALHGHVAIKALVNDDEAAAGLARALADHQLPANAVQVTIDPEASFFLRDMAVFGRTADGPMVVDFRWTEYGMPAWCNTRWGRSRAAVAECVEGADDERADLDRHIGGLAGASIYRSSIAVEGGAFETNGQGTVIANAQLYRSRNPARPLTEVDAALKRLPGVRQVIWVPAGLAEDPHLRASITRQHIGWGTGGHTDEFIRFAGPRTVLLAWPDDADVRRHPVSRITRSRMAAALAILNTTRTPDGQPWNVLKLPMPRPIQRVVILSRPSENDDDSDWQADEFPPEERRRPGDKVWEMAVATYMNFVVANGVVVLPDYRAHGTPPARQLKVQRVMEQAFPGRRIAFVDAISANWVGGGMHCATLNEF